MKVCGEWHGDVMEGTWGGDGLWSLADKTWTGGGHWKAESILYGTWNGNGAWKDSGEWQAKGDLFSNIKFPPGVEAMIYITSASITAAFSLLSYFVAKFGDVISISIGLVIFAITLIIYWKTQTTTKGQWDAKGKWEDIGDFRILKLDGNLKLGTNKCILSGIMKDTKPK
jgi:hypothetical protein